MSQRRRRTLDHRKADKLLVEAPPFPGSISTRLALQALLVGKGFAANEIFVADLRVPQAIATIYEGLDSGVAGTATVPTSYTIDLVADAGLPAGSKFAPKTKVYVFIVVGGNTHTVEVDNADAFSASSTGGSFTLNVGGCSINRSGGTVTVAVQATTDNLTGSNFQISAFILDGSGGLGFADHGEGWGEAEFSASEALLEIPHKKLDGTAFTDTDDGVIVTQSLPAVTTFPTTDCVFAILMAPTEHWKDHAVIQYSTSDDPKATRDKADASWTALSQSADTDLIGGAQLYVTDGISLAASKAIITFRVDMTLAIPETRTQSTFIYGWAVGIR